MSLPILAILLPAVSGDSSDEEVDVAEDLVVALRRREIHDDLREGQSGEQKLSPELSDKINHGTKLRNSVQPRYVACFAGVAVHVDEVGADANPVESGFDKALQNKKPAVRTVGTDVGRPSRKVAASNAAPNLLVPVLRTIARVDDVRNSTKLTGQIKLL